MANILVLLALVASFLISKFKRIFSFTRGNKGYFASNKRTLNWRPFWNKVYILIFLDSKMSSATRQTSIS